jgi:hypothetical protein
MRTAQRILMACLILLPTAAFADVYPLNPPPDLFIDNFVYTGNSLFGTVEGITDFGNCQSPCFAGLNFYADGNLFDVTDGSNDVLLGGNFITSAYGGGGEYGLMYSVTADDTSLWALIEGQAPSSFGSVVVIDIHDLDTDDPGYQPDVTADLTPMTTAATPEPGSLTLLFSGLAAVIVRKRMASRKA